MYQIRNFYAGVTLEKEVGAEVMKTTKIILRCDSPRRRSDMHIILGLRGVPSFVRTIFTKHQIIEKSNFGRIYIVYFTPLLCKYRLGEDVYPLLSIVSAVSSYLEAYEKKITCIRS